MAEPVTPSISHSLPHIFATAEAGLPFAASSSFWDLLGIATSKLTSIGIQKGVLLPIVWPLVENPSAFAVL